LLCNYAQVPTRILVLDPTRHDLDPLVDRVQRVCGPESRVSRVVDALSLKERLHSES
jgi:hypothetical protein